MLPESAVSYSRINLHTISVLDKSLLNQHNLNYWQLLRKTTRISTRQIGGLATAGETVGLQGTDVPASAAAIGKATAGAARHDGCSTSATPPA